MEIIPDEGLDYVLGVLLKAQTQPTNLYVGLFTSQTASTVPAANAVLATPTGVTEVSGWGYARQSIASSAWGTAGVVGSGRGMVGPQVSFPAATSTYSTAINGFFVATASTAGKALFYANFDDTTAIASLALGDIVKVTPTFSLLG